MWWAVDMIKTPPFGTSGATANDGPRDSTRAPPGGAYNSASNSVGVRVPDNGAVAPVAAPLTVHAPGVTRDHNYCSGTNAAQLVPAEDCTGFVFCQNGLMSGSVTKCSPGLLFDGNMGLCNWPSETNICGFDFCPDKALVASVPFEDCTKFYACRAGKIDGDVDVCPGGTLFDVNLGICNWASMVVCSTTAPSMRPTPQAVPAPAPPATVVLDAPTALSGVSHSKAAGVTAPRPTYGTVASEPFPPSYPVVPPLLVAPASTPTFQDNTARLRFAPSDDAYVQEDKPYENYNDKYIVADQILRYDGLLRFYVQGLENRRINYVRLRLYVSNQSNFGGNFYRSKHTWHEDVVTWDTAPSIRGAQPLAVVNAVLKDEWVEVDLTGLVDGDGPVSLRITSNSPDNVMYSSKENENGNAPELIVGVETVATMTSRHEKDSGAMDTPPTVTNTFRIGPTDDAFVSQATSNKNYGKREDLEVVLNNRGVKTAYLRFDLSRVHMDAVRSATLRLYATDSSMSGGTFLTVTDSDWDEDQLTYNNAPPGDGMVLGALYNVKAGEWYELDVTDAVTESRPFTICILGSHDDKIMYSSKDGTHSPEIALTLEEVVPLSSKGGKVLELLPTDDATIALQTPEINFGKDEQLTTDVSNEGMRNLLLRFDATDVPRGEVKSAVLRLYAENEEPAFGGTFVEASNNDWDERTVTWRSAPLSDGKVLGSLPEVERGSWYDLDVTPAVVGGAPVTFRVSSPSSRAAVYASRESNRGPKLIVQYKPPEPIPQDLDVYIPTDDASILLEKPTANFGRGDQLKVDGYGGVYNSLLRFDLSSVEKGTVEKAILRLYAIDGSPSGGTFVSTSPNWSQYTVTWDTAPAADGDILATLGEVVPYQWYEIEVAVDIAQNLGGEPFSIRIAPSHGLRCAYSSSEDRLGHLPQLLIKADIFKGMG